jgi:hypothetical protein
MKAVSVPAVDAWAITYAGYRHTNTPWPDYSGQIALHAADTTGEPRGVVQAWTRGDVPVGAVIAVAELDDGAIHNVRPLARPVACDGQDGLFDLPSAVAAAVREQFKAAARWTVLCVQCRQDRDAGRGDHGAGFYELRGDDAPLDWIAEHKYRGHADVEIVEWPDGWNPPDPPSVITLRPGEAS